MVNDAGKFKEEDLKVKERVDAKNKFENYCYNMKSSMDDLNLKDCFTDEDKTLINNLFTDSMAWIEENNKTTDAETI